jgi:hypothetical protein
LLQSLAFAWREAADALAGYFFKNGINLVHSISTVLLGLGMLALGQVAPRAGFGAQAEPGAG